jgi:uncharacterized membrane protein YphA (DoxX/SURF4 family)
MDFMDDSMAQPRLGAAVDLPAWKSVVGVSAAVLLALLFIVAGTWKITDPISAAARMAQAKVPAEVSLPFAVLLGVTETFAGVLLLVPRFRRWGAWLSGVLLVAFMIYIAVFYDALRGEECNCFPWIKRAVGPGFFIGDAVMLALAFLAGWWARKSDGLRGAALMLAAMSVFAVVSYGVTAVARSGVKAPAVISVDGSPASLERGRVVLYFFDPECMHCDEAARRMAKWNWKDTRVVAIATRVPHFTQDFLRDTQLRAGVSPDHDLLKKTFAFGDPPFAVALENGHQKAALTRFDEQEPGKTLRELGFIE